MQLYFIRHGQSENNALYDRTGSNKGRNADPGLTAVGRQQAALLAQFLRQSNPEAPIVGRDAQNVAGFGLTHLYTSLMTRSVATGSVVAEALGLPLEAWEDLHECGGIYLEDTDTGVNTGLPGPNRAFFETHFPRLSLPETLGQAGWWNRPHEPLEACLLRAHRALDTLCQRHANAADKVAWISHGGFFTAFLVAALDLPPREGLWFAMNNVAITRLDFVPEGIDVVYLNRADFLPRALIT